MAAEQSKKEEQGKKGFKKAFYTNHLVLTLKIDNKNDFLQF
jgi:hypothetical protein